MTEFMDVVNERDEVIGKATQDDIYAKKLNHRIVHVFVINPKNKSVYFQKRSETKSYLPGYYCTSAGGHVRQGETYLDAAMRELSEELGLAVPLKHVHSFVFTIDSHSRFVQLFLAYASDGISFSDGEVAGGEFLSLADAHQLVLRNEKIHPQLAACFSWLFAHPNVI